jgi:hypothetical protein
MVVSNIRPPIKFIHFARGAPHAMTNKELDAIDAKITAALKRNIGTAISTSSPLFHMDADTTHGLSFPSIRDIRTTAIIEKAHYLLNTDTPLGRIARSRVRALRDTLGWTTSPLANPKKSTPPHVARALDGTRNAPAVGD